MCVQMCAHICPHTAGGCTKPPVPPTTGPLPTSKPPPTQPARAGAEGAGGVPPPPREWVGGSPAIPWAGGPFKAGTSERVCTYMCVYVCVCARLRPLPGAASHPAAALMSAALGRRAAALALRHRALRASGRRWRPLLPGKLSGARGGWGAARGWAPVEPGIPRRPPARRAPREPPGREGGGRKRIFLRRKKQL